MLISEKEIGLKLGSPRSLMLRYVFHFFIMSLYLIMPQAWSYDLKAGDKKIHIQFKEVEVNPFCEKDPFGCARLKILNGNKKLEVGFLKVITNKLNLREFPKYCQETFRSMAKLSPEQNKYSEAVNRNTHFCTWRTGNEETTILWKDGITLLLSTSDSTLSQKIISQIGQASVL